MPHVLQRSVIRGGLVGFNVATAFQKRQYMHSSLTDKVNPVDVGIINLDDLTEVNHPDHLIVVYPHLGHTFVPSNQWISSNGEMPEYVFQDMVEWLSSPSRQK
jgi:hypothetical protein